MRLDTESQTHIDTAILGTAHDARYSKAKTALGYRSEHYI